MEALQQQLEALQAQNAALQQRITQQPEDPPAVSRISVKLPPFWKDNPAVWFAQIETQFNLAGITQEATKFAHVVAHLEERYASEVADLIIAPPAVTPYTTLKKQLIERVSVSENQRVRQLLTEEELGDRKPSQFLRHLRSLAGPELAHDKILRTLWQQRLPPHVQALLLTQPDTTSLDALATIADKVLEVQTAPIPAVHAVSSKPRDTLEDQLAELRGLISNLQSEIKSIKGRSRIRSRSPSPHPRGDRNTLCWYHSRFGDKAKKCEAPCQFQGNAAGSR